MLFPIQDTCLAQLATKTTSLIEEYMSFLNRSNMKWPAARELAFLTVLLRVDVNHLVLGYIPWYLQRIWCCEAKHLLKWLSYFHNLSKLNFSCPSLPILELKLIHSGNPKNVRTLLVFLAILMFINDLFLQYQVRGASVKYLMHHHWCGKPTPQSTWHGQNLVNFLSWDQTQHIAFTWSLWN